MMENEKTTISRAYNKAAYWQIIITLLVSCGSLLIAGTHAALSAIAGGGAVVIGGYAGMKMAQRNKEDAASAVLISLLKAEAIKVLVIAMLLLVIFKYYQGLVPLSLIGGLAGSALASGAGLQAMKNENNK